MKLIIEFKNGETTLKIDVKNIAEASGIMRKAFVEDGFIMKDDRGIPSHNIKYFRIDK